jgi:hypothetical protein
MAYQIDQATTQDLAVPTGWAGAHVLLCCLAGPTLPEYLHTAWRAAGTVYEPLEYLADPSMVYCCAAASIAGLPTAAVAGSSSQQRAARSESTPQQPGQSTPPGPAGCSPHFAHVFGSATGPRVVR